MNISKHWGWGDVDYLCLSDHRETVNMFFSILMLTGRTSPVCLL